MKKILVWSLIFMILAPFPAISGSGPIYLTIGESKLIHVESAKKVAIGNPEIADVTAVSDQEILLSAKSAGNTNLIFISPDGEKETRTVTVSAHNLKKAMVEVDVEIMEIDNQSALKAGLSWGSVQPTTETSSANGVSLVNGPVTPNNLTIGENSPPPLVSFGTFSRQSLTASMQLLIDHGKAKILSKPKLLAVSGSEASFLSGGEVPYVSQNSLGSSNVEWKP
ncbi:MAG TPA: pilus assembly protein N-terminal domain-containing protein, partial [bacterium]|nr:pilus assembly protein N-terminal domain-containing protein [bacterium]